MADVKISALTAVVTPATTDIVPVVQGGVTKQETVAQIRTVIMPVVLGTDTSGSLTLAGDASGTTAAVVNDQARGLKSATTTVSVSAATAPTSGQVLTATAGTTATWQTPTVFTAPTGTGVMTVTSGALDAASTGLGTAHQVFRTNQGATAVEWATPTAGCCTLEQFGAVGDGVTSDQTAIDAAFTALAAGTYNTLLLGAKTYLGTWGKTVTAGVAIIGRGHKSILKQTGAVQSVLVVGAVSDVTLRDFKILGDGTATTLAVGVRMGSTGSASSGPQRITISNVYVDNCWAAGFQYFANPKSPYHEGPLLIECRVKGAYRGFYFLEEGEYATLVDCKSNNNTYGLVVSAGNITAVGCDFADNIYGVSLETGTNDAHGIVANCNVNHNTTANVTAGAITLGHTFDGCHFFGGSILLTGSTGVVFRGCTIQTIPGTSLSFDGSLGTVFSDCTAFGELVINDDVNAHPSETTWSNVRLQDGTGVSATVGARVQASFTFASDANDTLTLQEAAADALVIANGTISVTRTITIPKPPASQKSVRRLIVNNNTYAVSFLFSTGTGVSVAAGTKAIIGSDGTNAITLVAAGSGSASTGATGQIQTSDGASGFSDGGFNVTTDTSTWGSTSPVKAVKARLSTTDATLTTLATYAIPSSTIVDFQIVVVGIRTGGVSGTAGDSYRCEMPVTYQRIAGAGPTLVGAAYALLGIKSNGGGSGYVPSLDISSNDLRVRVTGVATTNINWTVTVQGQECT